MTPDGGASRFLDGRRPRVFAHRGLALNAPGNTLVAFEHALRAGATHLETDVRASADGIAVISHDADFAARGTRRRVDRCIMNQLRRVDLGQEQSFASLSDALATFPDALFNVDVKSEAAIVATATAVLGADAVDRVLITSFSEHRRRRTVQLLPGVCSSASSSGVALAWAAARLGLSGGVRRSLRGISAVQVPVAVRGFRVVTPRFIRAMHLAGVEVHVWTVNEPSTMRLLLDAGVDGLVTDRCDHAVRVIAARN